MTRMSRRPGITLLEVLTAIFIMGVGMLAILVLFPLGALNMARALQDDRCGTIAATADSLAVAHDWRHDAQVVAAMTAAPTPGPAGSTGADAPNPTGPSYPVFADPYYAGTFSRLGSMPTPYAYTSPVRRVIPTSMATGLPREHAFTMTDDLTFELDGRPKDIGLSLERQGAYSWTYMFRRRKTNDPATTDMSVIVYRNRLLLVQQDEKSFVLDVAAVKDDTSMTLRWGVNDEAPEVRRGTWLLDVTYTSNVVGANRYGNVNAHFYRVINVSQPTAGTVVASTVVQQVEVEPPLRAAANQIVVLDNAVEVFDRGLGR